MLVNYSVSNTVIKHKMFSQLESIWLTPVLKRPMKLFAGSVENRLPKSIIINWTNLKVIIYRNHEKINKENKNWTNEYLN